MFNLYPVCMSVLTRELCQTLKDAGFDQTLIEGDRVYQGAENEALLVSSPEGTMEAQGDLYLRCPNLETLMELSGAESIVKEGEKWVARKEGGQEEGDTREEAAARLWMAR